MRKNLLFSTAALAAILALSGCDILEAIDKELDSASDASTRPDARHTDVGTDPEDAPTLSDSLKEGINTLSAIARRKWENLIDAQDNCDAWYSLDTGGMYTFYCHLNDEVDYGDLQDILSIPVFLSGPHDYGILDLDNRDGFGHYNPEFVKTLTLWTLPAQNNETFRKLTQYAYVYGPQQKARTYWATYQKLKANPEFWAELQNELQNQLDSDEGMYGGFYEGFYYFMNPLFIENSDEYDDFFDDRGYAGGYYDGYLVKIATGFWIRRGIDGTAEHFAAALEQLLTLYDADFLTQTNLESPTIRIDDNTSEDYEKHEDRGD